MMVRRFCFLMLILLSRNIVGCSTMSLETPLQPADEFEVGKSIPVEARIVQTLSKLIADDQLREVWFYLYQQPQVLDFSENVRLCGHDLAMYIIEHRIPIIRSEEPPCTGAACSIISCWGEECLYVNEDGVKPIYIRLSGNSLDYSEFSFLVDTMAHEIFHRMQLFGHVDVTQYEEYLAFYVGAKLLGSDWGEFEDYDLLNRSCLQRWFRHHGLDVYLAL